MATPLEILSEASALASKADGELEQGRAAAARKLYLRAARKTESGLSAVPESKEKTRSLFMNNIVALYWKSEKYQSCTDAALRFLHRDAPERIRPRLEDFLMWSIQATRWKGPQGQRLFDTLASVTPMRIELHPRGIPSGFVQVDEISSRYIGTRKFVRRGAEYQNISTLGQGDLSATPPTVIQKAVNVFAANTSPGSYKVDLWVQSDPVQFDMFSVEPALAPDSRVLVDQVTNFLSLMSVRDAFAIEEEVPSEPFRYEFLRIIQSLCPDGDVIEGVEISGGEPGSSQTAYLSPEIGEFSKTTIKKMLGTKTIRTVEGELSGIQGREHHLLLTVRLPDGTEQNIQISREHEDAGKVMMLWEKDVTVTAEVRPHGNTKRWYLMAIEQANGLD